MERILILMAATDVTEARVALTTALENASSPGTLAIGLSLEQKPTEEESAWLSTWDRLRILTDGSSPWDRMPDFWNGEAYVLMASPAMRFEHHWDRALLHQWRNCSQLTRRKQLHPIKKVMEFFGLQEAEGNQQVKGPIVREEEEIVPFTPPSHVITGCLPLKHDETRAIYPVAADQLTPDGTLTFHRGIPMQYATHAFEGPFLHQSFCFGPAGFFRSVGGSGAEPYFLRAHVGGWALYTPTKAPITLLYAEPILPVQLDGEMAGLASFAEVFGIDLRAIALSPQIRRGMRSPELEFRLRVPWKVRHRHAELRKRHQRAQAANEYPIPQVITYYTDQMDMETLRWLKRLNALEDLSMSIYAEPRRHTEVQAHLPGVLQLRPKHLLRLPCLTVEEQQRILSLSKVQLIWTVITDQLDTTHYIWMDPDCVQYPLYEKTALQWHRICKDLITLAMVDGEPDASMIVIPGEMLKDLAITIATRCDTWLREKRVLPTEQELWMDLIREHPAWFRLYEKPMTQMLFSMLLEEDE